MVSTSIALPFFAHNYEAYCKFCPSSSPPAWCHSIFPLVYPYVQAAYWDVCFFNYWQLNQLPNLLIALPPLRPLRLRLPLSLPLAHFLSPSLSLFPSLHRPICPPCPLHPLHALFMSLILLFAFHSQIVLRFAPSMPFTYRALTYILTHTAILGLLLSKSLVLSSVVFCHSMSRFFTSHLIYTLYTYIITTLDLDHRM